MSWSSVPHSQTAIHNIYSWLFLNSDWRRWGASAKETKKTALLWKPLMLFRVLHCTSTVTLHSVFPLYFVNGWVQLGNSESVLIQHPYLSDASPLSQAAGRIGPAVSVATHEFWPAILIAAESHHVQTAYITVPKHTWTLHRCTDYAAVESIHDS